MCIRDRGRHPARHPPAAVIDDQPDPARVTRGADPAAVGPYLAETLGDDRWLACTVDLISGGKSNLTYVVESAAGALVLRRPPLGGVLPTAHDMVREYRVITALRDTAVPVPRTYALCEDPAVLGAPFYLMERVAGPIVGRELPPGYADRPEQRRRIGEGLIDVLAALHAVDVEAVGLGDFGRPEGFLARQARRWSQQWERSRVDDMPALDRPAADLATGPEVGSPVARSAANRSRAGMSSTRERAHCWLQRRACRARKPSGRPKSPSPTASTSTACSAASTSISPSPIRRRCSGRSAYPGGSSRPTIGPATRSIR